MCALNLGTTNAMKLMAQELTVLPINSKYALQYNFEIELQRILSIIDQIFFLE